MNSRIWNEKKNLKNYYWSSWQGRDCHLFTSLLKPSDLLSIESVVVWLDWILKCFWDGFCSLHTPEVKPASALETIGLILQDLLFLAILVLQKVKLEESPISLPLPTTPPQTIYKNFEEMEQWGSEIISPWQCPSTVGTRAPDTLRHFRNKCVGGWIEASSGVTHGSRASPHPGHQMLLADAGAAEGAPQPPRYPSNRGPIAWTRIKVRPRIFRYVISLVHRACTRQGTACRKQNICYTRISLDSSQHDFLTLEVSQ